MGTLANATRWNSLLTLLQSLSKAYEVKKVLHDANQENCWQNIDMIVVKALIHFLIPSRYNIDPRKRMSFDHSACVSMECEIKVLCPRKFH